MPLLSYSFSVASQMKRKKIIVEFHLEVPDGGLMAQWSQNSFSNPSAIFPQIQKEKGHVSGPRPSVRLKGQTFSLYVSIQFSLCHGITIVIGLTVYYLAIGCKIQTQDNWNPRLGAAAVTGYNFEK